MFTDRLWLYLKRIIVTREMCAWEKMNGPKMMDLAIDDRRLTAIRKHKNEHKLYEYSSLLKSLSSLVNSF